MHDEGFIIRAAGINDLAEILAIETTSFGADSFSRKQFIYLIKYAKGAFFVVQSNRKVVAYISLLLHARTQNARIYSIAVDPAFRNLKLGQLLLDKAIEFAQEKQARKMTLEVKVSNKPAINLYLKNGFEATRIKYNYYHDGSDAYYMQRTMGNK